MSIASVTIFTRMSPAIKTILKENSQSIEGATHLLAFLAQDNEHHTLKSALTIITKLEKNITEDQEHIVVKKIHDEIQAALNNDIQAKKNVVSSLQKLIEINMNAMRVADIKAQHLGEAGAWAIVFCTVGVFIVGFIFLDFLKRRVLSQLVEIGESTKAFVSGDKLRRCTVAKTPRDIYLLSESINDIMDEAESQKFSS